MSQDVQPSEPKSAPDVAASRMVGISDTALTFVSRLLSMGVLFLGQMLSAYFLDPEGRGSYAVVTMYMSLLLVVFALGSDSGCLYYVAARRFTPSQGVIHISLFALLAAIPATVVGLAAMGLPLEMFKKAAPESFYLVLMVLPIQFVAASLIIMPTSLRDFGWYGVILVSTSCVQVFNIVLFLGLLKWGVNGAVMAMMTTNVISATAVLVFLRRKHDLHWVWPTRKSLGQVLDFGLRYYFGKISNLVNFQLGTLLLALSGESVSEADIGLFAFAMTMTVSFTVIPDTLATVILPRVAVDTQGRADLVAMCARLAGIVCAVAMVTFAALAYPFFSLVIPKFVPAVTLIWVLIPGLWVRCASKLAVPYLQCRNHVGIASVAVVLGVVTNLVLMVVLLPWLGTLAAAIATGANYLVSSVVLAVAFRRVSGMGWAETWLPTRADLSILFGVPGALLARVRGR